MSIIERITSTFECAQCAASFSHLADAVLHTRHAHMCDGVTQYEAPECSNDFESTPELLPEATMFDEASSMEVKALPSPQKPRRKRCRSSKAVVTKSLPSPVTDNVPAFENDSLEEPFLRNRASQCKQKAEVKPRKYPRISLIRGDLPRVIAHNGYTYRWQESRSHRASYRCVCGK